MLEWRRPALYLIAALVACWLIAPTLIILPMSISTSEIVGFPPTGFTLKWYREFLADPGWQDSSIASWKIAALTTVLATGIGCPAAFGLVRGRYPGKAVIAAVLLSPMIVPVVVVAIGMFFVFSDWGLVGTLSGFVIAHTVLALPIVVVAVAASLRNFDVNLELAAQNLGAGPWQTFRRITLPLILPGVIAGALFAFMTSWDEVVVAIFLSSPLLETLPVRMWTEVRQELSPVLPALAAMLIGLTTVLVVAALAAGRKGRHVE